MAQKGITRRRLIGGAAAGAAAVALPDVARAARRRRPRRRRRRHADVLVVGAGFSGIAAARQVHKAGHSVLVLEARRRVGGRVLNHPIGNGKYTELGGMFTGPTQDHIQALAKEVGVGLFDTYNPDGANNVFYTPRGRETYQNNGPTGTAPLDPVVDPDIALAVEQLDQMSTSVPVDRPWTASSAEDWDRQTLETWLREHTSGSSEFMAVARAATEAIFGAEPRDFSLLYTLFYIAASGNEQNPGTFERNFNTKDGAQEKRFVGGAQHLAKRAAHGLGRRVRLRTPVRRIEQHRHGVRVVSDRASFTGKRVIVAIPPTLAGRIVYSPKLPALRDQLTQRMPQGSLRKFEAIYDRPFWRDQGLTGQAVSEEGPIKVTFDTSPADGTPGVLMGFIGGTEARVWSRKSRAERRAACLQNLVNYFGEAARNPRKIVEFDWSTEVWTRGCPVSLLPPGALIDFGEALRTPVRRIHWAATETSTYWNGYMDGAVRAGERAAAEAVAAL